MIQPQTRSWYSGSIRRERRRCRFADMLPTQGRGGAAGNAGILQFKGDLGAVANYGSNSVSPLVRRNNFIGVEGTMELAPNCKKPDSVALSADHLFVVGANCAESHAWPSGRLDGTVALSDPSAAQIVVGKDWAAVTMSSGSLLQLPLRWNGSLNGSSAAVTLPQHGQQYPAWCRVLGRCPGIHARAQPRQLRHREQHSGGVPDNRTHSPLPRQRSVLGGQGAGEHLVHRQLPGGGHLHFPDRRPREESSTSRYPCRDPPTDITVVPG